MIIVTDDFMANLKPLTIIMHNLIVNSI